MHKTKVTQVFFRSMHFALELAEFYTSSHGAILKRYNFLIGRVLHGLLIKTFS